MTTRVTAHDQPVPGARVIDEEVGTQGVQGIATPNPAMAATHTHTHTHGTAATGMRGDISNGEGKDASGNGLSRTQATAGIGLMLLSFAGFAIYLGGLSAFQHYVNDDNNTAQWSIPSDYPYLTPSHVFRWDWWVLAGFFIAWLYVGAVLVMGALSITRPAVAALLAAFAVLTAISADRFYNARTFVRGSQWSSTTAAFTGALLCSTAFFLLLLTLGSHRWRF